MAVRNVLELFSKPTAEWFQNTFGEPTQVQKETWPQIAAGRPVLVSAPTGTGKTLSAFLIFLDQLMRQAQEGTLREGLQLIYISPLKSLAADIRENLRRPLEGIQKQQGAGEEISVAIRTGDTSQKERQQMAKHPPYILITTPESLFLLLTSASGQKMLKTARAVVIDELHALIDTKRGAHLLFSIARLEKLCEKRLQRIGLSATIEPLDLAAQWLSVEEAAIVAPAMQKKKEITVAGITPSQGRRKDPVWEELAQRVYDCCKEKRSVIAFSEGRRYAEKLSYYVNQIAGEDFARVHHGSLSKEQRAGVEEALRSGKLRLLCATSSMELGIDVGEVDEVLQIGCPRTVSSAMQRLGRAGHDPGRVSVMRMYPRTAPEGLYCGMTAALALQGCVEEADPPRLCLDVLAQHLVSMAAGGKNTGKAAYSVEDVLALTKRAWPFYGVTREMVTGLLRMLAGDYEHNREIPVRPRVLYDRIHEVVYPDPYSRMLAVAAGGTIPDKGMYAAKTLDGVKLGELDEEFVYESYVGDRFLLGSFGWRIVGQDKDTVYVEPASADSARIPFWKGEIKGRSLKTGLKFGNMLAGLGHARDREDMLSMLADMGLDDAAAQNTADFIGRQIASTGCLPDDRTILAEHFCDHTGSHQLMIHSMFGRRINAPFAIVLQDVLREKYHMNVGCVDEENGILLYPYGTEKMPKGIWKSIDPQKVRGVLEAALLQTPLFSITFRYNAARALMMGMRRNGRQPLWMQRLRSTEMLDSLIRDKEHPLMVETRRECLEDLWDVEGLLWLLSGIRSGLIGVREVYVDVPSPMSLPLQWQAEAAEMYSYAPVTPGIQQESREERRLTDGIKPSETELQRVREEKKMPQNAAELHTLLMVEGDLEIGELEEICLGAADFGAAVGKGARKALGALADRVDGGARSGENTGGNSGRRGEGPGDGSARGCEEAENGGAWGCEEKGNGSARGCEEAENGGAQNGEKPGGGSARSSENPDGDIVPVWGKWLEELAQSGLAAYIEPGLWIAAEQQEEYAEALAWMSGVEENSGCRGGRAGNPDCRGGRAENPRCPDGRAENPGYLDGRAAKVGCPDERNVKSGYSEEGDARGDFAQPETGGCRQIPESTVHILRRMLYYRGPAEEERICQRYAARRDRIAAALENLKLSGSIVEEDGIFYHAKLYERAQRATLKSLRREVKTQPAEHFAALMAQRSRISAAAADQLLETVRLYCGQPFPAGFWEEVLFPARVKNYRESMLDSLLAEGDYFWRFGPDGRLCFEASEDVDWEAYAAREELSERDGNEETGNCRKAGENGSPLQTADPGAELTGNEKILYEQLKKRGASFLKQLSRCLESGDAQETLLTLAQKGLVYADSFVPVRQSLNKEKIARATTRQRVSARVQAMSAGRWDLVRPCRKKIMEEWLEQLFMQNLILCRETWRRPEADIFREENESMTWSDALAVLRVWEYVGRVRRGYFVSGMSGAQFIRQEDYLAVTQALSAPEKDIIWLNAADPACIWGKMLPYPAERGFTGVPSTAVALKAGRILAVLERKGKVFRVFEEECLEALITELASAFRGRRLFAGQKRMVIREYPESAGVFFKAAGFIREMQDHVLYLS